LPGPAARTQELGPERTSDAHQQARRPLSANAFGAGCTAHSRPLWRGQRSAALGSEAGRAWRQEREETSHHRHGTQVGSVVASLVGKRRSVRTAAQQPATSVGDRSIKTKTSLGKESQKPRRRVPVTASIAWPTSIFEMEREVDNQVAAPAETRIPNLHRAKRPLIKSADGRVATVALGRRKT